jgi:hypothetical protein
VVAGDRCARGPGGGVGVESKRRHAAHARGLLGREPGEINRLVEEVGSVLNGVTFLTAAPLANRYGRWYDAHPR